MLKKLLVALAALSIGLPALSQTGTGTGSGGSTQVPPGRAGAQGEIGAQGPARPDGPPGGAGIGGTFVTTQAQFVTAVNAAIAGCYIINFATGSKFIVTGTMNFILGDCGQTPVGGTATVCGSPMEEGRSITAEVSSALRRTLKTGPSSRLVRPSRRGTTTATMPGLRDPDPGQRGRPIYKFTLRDWWIDYCGGHGLVLSGDVYLRARLEPPVGE